MKKFFILFTTMALISCLAISAGATDIFANEPSENKTPGKQPTANSTVNDKPAPKAEPTVNKPVSASSGAIIPMPNDTVANDTSADSAKSKDIFTADATPPKQTVAVNATTNLKTGGTAIPRSFFYVMAIIFSALFGLAYSLLDHSKVFAAGSGSRGGFRDL